MVVRRYFYFLLTCLLTLDVFKDTEERPVKGHDGVTTFLADSSRTLSSQNFASLVTAIFGMLVNKAYYRHSEGRLLNAMADESISKFLGVGKPVYLVVKQLICASSEESVDRGLFHNLTDRCMDVV